MFFFRKLSFLFFTAVLLPVPAGSKAQIPFSKGVNLTGWFQANSPEEIQFTSFTRKDIANIKSLGCDVIRLPINLHNMTSGSPDYVLSPLFCSLLDSAITWCERQEIYLILDNHTFDPNVNTSPDIGRILTRVWSQMASRYKDRSKYILYEVLNEPHGITTESWGIIQQSVINSIRANDTKHTIVVGGSGWNSYNELSSLPSYSDTNLIYTFHFYDPFLFTHQGATWVNPSMASLSGVPFPYDISKMPVCPADLIGTWIQSDLNNGYKTEGTVSSIRNLIEMASNFRNTRRVRVFCGEFGTFMENSLNGDRCRWYKAVRSILDSLDIPWTTWDYKGGFGLFNRNTWEIFDHDLNVTLLDSLGLNVPPQTPYVQRPDSVGFMIYDDFVSPGIYGSRYGTGSASFYYTNTPEAGNYCIDWSGFSQYNALVFDFSPDRDLSQLALNNYALDLMIRGSAPGIKFEIRFRDAKTATISHPWRMGTTIDQLQGDLKWHHFYIPLSSFNERGAWDNNTWYNAQGLFDWSKVDVMEVSTEWTDIIGKRVWFDNIGITNMDTSIVRVNQPVGVEKINVQGPDLFRLFPNPLRGDLYISSFSSDICIVNVEIFSITGARIRSLKNISLSMGANIFLWDGKDMRGSELPAGYYLCQITSGSLKVVKRIVKY